jgi:outer membrane protein assembly factor BamA
LARIRAFTIFALLALLSPGSRARGTGADLVAGNGQTGSLAHYDGLIIDSIVIDNRNIYDVTDPRYSGLLFRAANKLHVVTRKNTIRKELLFREGGPFSSTLAVETVRNLRNRLRLYQSWLEVEKLKPSGNLRVKVVTVDQWSFSGGVEVSREGNRNRYRVWGEEQNLLGRNLYLDLEFHSVEQERNFLTGRFLDKRLFGKSYSLAFDYSDDPRAKSRLCSFGKPYYNLLQKFSFGVKVQTTGGRTDHYRDNVRIAESMHDGDLATISAEYRFGSYRRKLSLYGLYSYRYERVYGRKVLSDRPEDTLRAIAGFPRDSLYHLSGLGVKLASVNFVTTRHIDVYGCLEDLPVGQVVQTDFSRAFESDFRGHHYDLLGFQVSQGYHFRDNLFFLTYKRLFWFRGNEDLRRFSWLSAKYYNNGLSFFTLATRAAYFSEWNNLGNDELNLGGVGSIRGFDEYFRTGDRLAVASVEGRFFPGLEILSVGIGAAVFADFGQTWKAGESIDMKSVYGAAGVGLRFYSERTSKGRVLRFDVSYSDINSWQVSVGTGQYFPALESDLLLTNW